MANFTDIQKKPPQIIGIMGYSGSGKSTAIKTLKEKLESKGKTVVILSQDDYFKKKTKAETIGDAFVNINFDTPERLRMKKFGNDLSKIKNNKNFAKPKYEFGAHTNDSIENETNFSDYDYILIDGMFLAPEHIYDKDTKENPFDKLFFIDTKQQVALYRRIVRDAKHRGEPYLDVSVRWLRDIYPAINNIINPAVDNKDNKIVKITDTSTKDDLYSGAEDVINNIYDNIIEAPSKKPNYFTHKWGRTKKDNFKLPNLPKSHAGRIGSKDDIFSGPIKKSSPFIYSIIGSSGSGKTEAAKRLLMQLQNQNIECDILSMDNYYKPRSEQVKQVNEDINYDAPSAFDLEAFNLDLQKIKNGESIKKRIYDKATGEVRYDGEIYFRDGCIIEGLYVTKAFGVNTNLIDREYSINMTFYDAVNERTKRDKDKQTGVSSDNDGFANYVEQYLKPAYNRYVEKDLNNTTPLKRDQLDNQGNIEQSHITRYIAGNKESTRTNKTVECPW